VIYQVNAKLILDTRTNKVIIESHDKRLVFFPGKKIAEHWVDVTLDDRPQGGLIQLCQGYVQVHCAESACSTRAQEDSEGGHW
jgi:hypothetical protein